MHLKIALCSTNSNPEERNPRFRFCWNPCFLYLLGHPVHCTVSKSKWSTDIMKKIELSVLMILTPEKWIVIGDVLSEGVYYLSILTFDWRSIDHNGVLKRPGNLTFRPLSWPHFWYSSSHSIKIIFSFFPGYLWVELELHLSSEWCRNRQTWWK